VALLLQDDWIRDSWLVDDGERYHLFFLPAQRALLDPGLRRARATIAHAAICNRGHVLKDQRIGVVESDDLHTWRRVTDHPVVVAEARSADPDRVGGRAAGVRAGRRLRPARGRPRCA
jgi:beta-fructofuranosidase